ncbi:MAG TPA: HDOD domain-containing protein [Bryobacteraceae bacterium]|jgi:putative nucleotidyltransferase with HDIG domain|nr:HDOD domain-containing protein [Bryobacteraceae bacterium]
MKLFKTSSSQKKSLRRVIDETDTATVAAEERASVQEMLEKREVETAQLGALAKLPPFGPVAISLMRLFDRDDVEMHDIVRLVSSDAALSSQLLALANSPLFGVQTSIRDLQHAITVLGTDRTKALATTLAMRTFLSSAPKTPVLRRIWRHGLATAVIAEVLAPSYGLSKDLGRVAGILHDVGRVALLAAYPEQYDVLAMRTHENTDSILVAERQQFGLDHCQAGTLLSESWHFPKELLQVIAQHLEAPTGEDLVSVVQVACRLATDTGFPAVARQDHHTGVNDIIEAHVPPAIRGQVVKSMSHIDQQILDQVESLDF